ncbi:MAG: response regulator transcription factor [Dehalococcoidia bacterium]|nr:response regulator transcription factor [Dehalococcoidia bacterium]MCB9486003.1 response regulator transcription factor [Thermoflexaceae bacterium]
MALPEDVALHFTRSLHRVGFAVLERAPMLIAGRNSLQGEFDLVACVVTTDRPESVVYLGELAATGAPLIALLPDATPELVSASLHAGADACLQMDADERVVTAQVQAVLRRRNPASTSVESECGFMQIGDLSIDTDRCEVSRQGEYVPLTASEYRIIVHMARNSGRVLRPHEILNAVSDDYEYRPREAQDVFKVYVRRIRRKLEPDEIEPRYLVTVRGMGYRLDGGSDRGQRVARTA